MRKSQCAVFRPSSHDWQAYQILFTVVVYFSSALAMSELDDIRQYFAAEKSRIEVEKVSLKHLSVQLLGCCSLKKVTRSFALRGPNKAPLAGCWWQISQYCSLWPCFGRWWRELVFTIPISVCLQTCQHKEQFTMFDKTFLLSIVNSWTAKFGSLPCKLDSVHRPAWNSVSGQLCEWTPAICSVSFERWLTKKLGVHATSRDAANNSVHLPDTMH